MGPIHLSALVSVSIGSLLLIHKEGELYRSVTLFAPEDSADQLNLACLRRQGVNNLDDS